jgi:membrane protease YdiL (CAAX protease family)
MVRRALIFYLGLTALGAVVAATTSVQPILFLPLREDAPPLYWQFVFGVGGGAILSLVSFLLERYIKGADLFERFLRQLFIDLSRWDAITLALLSSLAEEWLFRSVGVPYVGPLLSSVLFGCVHIPPDWRMAYWPVVAGILGYAFARWTQWSDSVLGATLAHFFINLISLWRISRSSASTLPPPASQGPTANSSTPQ